MPNPKPVEWAPLGLLNAGLAALGLCALVATAWYYRWEPRPEVASTREFGAPPEFAAIRDTQEMKSAFYAYLTPIVEYHNDQIRAERERLQAIRSEFENGGEPGLLDRLWLEELTLHYDVQWDDEVSAALLETLLRRADIVPVELALAQAAKESGWGRSRFAEQANNYFGQWCYQPGCGIVPAKRRADAKHEVEEFESVSESIRRYMNNLNSHERYRKFREIRAKLRAEGERITGLAVARGLTFYSQRRDKYVQEVQAMIKRYREWVAAQEGDT